MIPHYFWITIFINVLIHNLFLKNLTLIVYILFLWRQLYLGVYFTSRWEINYLKNLFSYFFRAFVGKAADFKNQSCDVLPLNVTEHTRSHLMVTVLLCVYLRSLTQKTYKTKKNHDSSFTGTRDRKGDVLGHVTLMYKVLVFVLLHTFDRPQRFTS